MLIKTGMGWAEFARFPFQGRIRVDDRGITVIEGGFRPKTETVICFASAEFLTIVVACFPPDLHVLSLVAAVPVVYAVILAAISKLCYRKTRSEILRLIEENLLG